MQSIPFMPNYKYLEILILIIQSIVAILRRKTDRCFHRDDFIAKYNLSIHQLLNG